MNLLLRQPFSFFIRSSFRRMHSLIYLKNQKTVSEELIFDRDKFQVILTEYARPTKERMTLKTIVNKDVARQYEYFKALLLGSNFFKVYSDTVYSYEVDVVPDPERMVQYEFTLCWRWNGKVIYFIELTDNTYEGISEENREKSGILEEYLKKLEQDAVQKTKSNPH